MMPRTGCIQGCMDAWTYAHAHMHEKSEHFSCSVARHAHVSSMLTVPNRHAWHLERARSVPVAPWPRNPRSWLRVPTEQHLHARALHSGVLFQWRHVNSTEATSTLRRPPSRTIPRLARHLPDAQHHSDARPTPASPANKNARL